MTDIVTLVTGQPISAHRVAPEHARTATRTGQMASYVQALAAELNATSTATEGDDSRWMHIMEDGPRVQGAWHYLELREHGSEVTIGRMLVRRQNGNAGRVTITPLLGEHALGSRGYYVSDEDKPALKPLTGELVSTDSTSAVRSMARRITKRTPAWLALIGKAAAWHGTRVSDQAARDKLANSITTLYGGFARGLGDEKASGVTVYPDAPAGSAKHRDTTSVFCVEIEAGGQAAELTLRHVPAELIGKIFELLGY